MDDDRYRVFERFIAMHHTKARPTGEPIVHMQFYGADRPPLGHDTPLLLMREEDLIEGESPPVNREAPLVRQLLRQLRTYDYDHQRIVGLIFDRDTVLSHVMEMPRV